MFHQYLWINTMTQKRIEHLITYFKGSLSMLTVLKDKEPEKFEKNGKIASAMFTDTLNILNHLKSLPDEVSKIEQNSEDYDTIFDEIASSMKSE